MEHLGLLSCMHCLFAGSVQGEEDEEELDLSQLSDEDAKAVMDMLSPEEQVAFQEMLDEHKRKFNSGEL